MLNKQPRLGEQESGSICRWSKNTKTTHPYVHCLCPLTPMQGHEKAGACPSGHQARGKIHHGQPASPSHGQYRERQTTTHTHPKGESNFFWDCRRMFLERTHTWMGRTCKLHTERSQLRFEPETFLLWGNSPNHQKTTDGK